MSIICTVKFAKLKGIAFDRNKIKEGAIHIATIINNSKNTLEYLSCVNNEFAPKELSTLISSLQECTYLKTLILDEAKLMRSDQAEFHEEIMENFDLMIANNPNLVKLSLADCLCKDDFTEKMLKSLIFSETKLKYLNLNGNDLKDIETLKTLSEYILLDQDLEILSIC